MKRSAAPASASSVWRLSDQGRWRRAALLSLAGVSGLVSPAASEAAGFGSSAWFAQSGAAPAPGTGGATVAAPRSTTEALNAGATTPDQALIRADRSLRNLHSALDAIEAERLQQYTAGHNISLEAPPVPDGLQAGGLVPAVEAPVQHADGNACLSAAQCVWVNADLPQQTTQADSRATTVTVRQTDDKAILTWESFNVGANTTLHIDQREGTQSDGKNDWIALNRVKPHSSPSVIQGQIKAEGTVYLLNQNGVLFDAGSMIDTHSVMVSSLPLYLPVTSDNLRQSTAEEVLFSNQQFLRQGLLTTGNQTVDGNILGLSTLGTLTVRADSVDQLPAILPGEVRIAEGAQLSIKDEGFGLIAAPNIQVDGTIEATDSQLALVAGLGVQIERASGGGRRFDVHVAGRVADASAGNADITPVFSIQNTGLIRSLRGGITLLGTRIRQDGVLVASTSVARQGYIDLTAADTGLLDKRYGLVAFGRDSTTALLPDSLDDQTNSSDSADAQFQPQGLSVEGSAIVLDGGALIETPGHDVELHAVAEDSDLVRSTVTPAEGVAGRIYVAPDATIDVAGLADVEVPLSDLLITVPRIGLNELADSPLQRDGVLFAKPLVFDRRDTGVRADGLEWVGTPLANLRGYVENITRGVRELLVDAGDISLIGNEVIADFGSRLNLAGGYLHYGGGDSNASRLVTASGAIVDIAHADPNVRYIGFAGQSIEQHPRWNINETFINPILRAAQGTVYEAEDVGGGNAGKLTVFGQTTSLLAGRVDAWALSGRRQLHGGTPSLGGTLQFGGSFLPGLYPSGQELPTAGPSYAVVPEMDPELLREVTASSLPLERGGDPTDLADPAWWTPVSARVVSESGASVLRVYGDLPSGVAMGGEVRVVDGAQVRVTPGGSAAGENGVSISAARIELSGSRVDIDGELSAPSGVIDILSTGRTYFEGSTVLDGEGDFVTGDIRISAASRLDARGQFVNDTGLGESQGTGDHYIHGGSIRIRALQSAFATDPGTPPIEDDPETPEDESDPGTPPTVSNLSGSILLAPGSVLDVMSGAYVQTDGSLARTGDNVVRGRAGSIQLGTYEVAAGANPFGISGGAPLPTDLSTLLDGTGRIELGAELYGYGFDRGGRLALRAPGILLDGGIGVEREGFLSVDPDLFSAEGLNGLGRPITGGFASFRFDGLFDAIVTAGTELDIAPRQFLPGVGGDGAEPLSGLHTGADLLQGLDRGELRIGRLDDLHLRPTEFELYGGDYLNWIGGFADGELVPPVFLDELEQPLVSGITLIDVGARIFTDPRSRIVLGSHYRVTHLGDIVNHGGSVTLTADTGGGGYLNNPGVINDPYFTKDKWVLLGAESSIDVSGVVLYDTTTVPEGTSAIPVGDVIAGGEVTLTADTGYVVALACSDTQDCSGAVSPLAPAGATPTSRTATSKRVIPKFGDNNGGSGGSGNGGSDPDKPDLDLHEAAHINISGASGAVGLLAPCLRLADATILSSDAGSLRVGAASGLFFHGNIQGKAGSSSAQGGALVIAPLNPLVPPESGFAGARRLLISQEAPEMPEQFLVEAAEFTDPDGQLRFSADLLTGSGVTTLHLGSDPLLSAEPVPVDFITDVTLDLKRELQINTLLLSAQPPIPDSGKIKPLEVALSAAHVALHGYSRSAGVYDEWETITVPGLPEIRRPVSDLTVDAGVMDIGGHLAVENFSDVAMGAETDIRFVTPPQFGSFNRGDGVFQSLPGVLLVGGNLSMEAGRIYPASAHQQIIIADNHIRRSDVELIVKPIVKDEFGDPLLTYRTLYQPSTATIRFGRRGAGGGVPLSVGGSLVVSATEITQNGTLYAPGGSIQLGIANDQILEGVEDDEQVFNYGLLPLNLDQLPYFRFSLPSVASTDLYYTDDLINFVFDDFEHPPDTDDTIAYDREIVTQVALETITNRLSYGKDSVTSVSLAGLELPYGRTVDGLNLVYNASGVRNASLDNLREAPDKRIGAIARTVNVAEGAVLDASGGGELFATEWVAGTGGTRDVLSTTNLSFAGGTPREVPLYADGREVYAILPGFSGLAPYDPALQLRSDSGGPLVGQAVYLTGIEGLAEGIYTLLPGAYSVLPGAMRLVQDTRKGAQDAIASLSNRVLADGTLQITGAFVDQLSGARSPRSTSFLVQSQPVWSQYSEYQFTRLNAYFQALEAASGEVRRAPADAGTLAFSATTKLDLDGELRVQRTAGYKGVDLQIAAPYIVVGDGGADPGFLALDATRLSNLDARRILLGATAGPTGDGIEELYVDAHTVVAATSAADPLRAEEIVLVGDGAGVGEGVELRPGATLLADGPRSGRRGPEVSIGGDATRQRQVASEEDGTLVDADEPDALPVAGDGAYLQVSVNEANLPGRLMVTGVDGADGVADGTLNISADARLIASGALGLDASSSISVAPTVVLQSRTLAVGTPHISLADHDRSQAYGLLIGPTLQAQIAGISRVILSSSVDTQILGNVRFGVLDLLELNGPQLISDGGLAQLGAETIVLANNINAGTGFGAGGEGVLTLNAERIELLGDRSVPNTSIGFDGFRQLQLNASSAVAGIGSGRLLLGGAGLGLDTPILDLGSGSNINIVAAGAVDALNSRGQAAVPGAGLGGRFSLEANSIRWDIALQATAGSIRFAATQGLRLDEHAQLLAGGGVFAAYDQRLPLSAGLIQLTAGSGDLFTNAGSLLEVSAGAAGGNAGEIRLTSQQGAVLVNGALHGQRHAEGEGARLSIASADSLDLARLSQLAVDGGIDGGFSVRSGSGDLLLRSQQTIKAEDVRLVADGGSLNIAGTIDARGTDGGHIALYAARTLGVSGALLASATELDGEGGQIELGVGASSAAALDATYGYQALSAAEAGRIDLGASALIDVSGASEGRIQVRAPLLADHGVPLNIAEGARLLGDARPELEIFARWDANDASTGVQHFTGSIDPAGSSDVLGPASDLARFYTETLYNYVRTPGWSLANLGPAAAWQLRAGLVLSTAGDLNVLSDWNLAAGHLDLDGRPVLDFRTDGVAPTLNLLAAGNVSITASISDGFFQVVNPFNPGMPGDVDNGLSPSAASLTNPLPLHTASLLGLQADGTAYDSSSLRIVAGADLGSSDPLGLRAAAGGGNVQISGERTAVSTAPGNAELTFTMPTLVRTGTGSIEVAALGSLSLNGAAPAVIYTAGHADVAGVVQPMETALQTVTGGTVPVLNTGNVQPHDAGDIRLSAGEDINAASIATRRYWWPWMQADCFGLAGACELPPTSSSINFGMFNQGVLSAGGDVTVSAGRSVRGLSVSLPTTWTRADGRSEDGIGGGDLSVRAGADILGGSYFVSEGEGELRAFGVLGQVGAAPLLALQDAQLHAEAAAGFNIGGIFNPSYLFEHFDANAYSVSSAVSLITAAGDGLYGSIQGAAIPGPGASPLPYYAANLLPAHLRLMAASGQLTLNRGGELYSSPDGQLELYALRNISLTAFTTGVKLGMIDAPVAALPSIDNPLVATLRPAGDSFIAGPQANFLLRDPELLHAEDEEPMRIYSVAGSLLNGYRNASTLGAASVFPEYRPASPGMRLYSFKPAEIRAGQDIVNLAFSGQNFYASDITTVAAGRDLLNPRLLPIGSQDFVPVIELGGPGTLAVSAGRDLGPLTSAGDARDRGFLNIGNPQYPGIRTVGNANNLYVDRTGADIDVSFGVGPGINLDVFAERYLNPAVNHDPLDPKDALGTPDYSAALVAYIKQVLSDAQRRQGEQDNFERTSEIAAIDAAGAWEVFKTLPVAQRQKFVADSFLDILNQVGLDYNAVTRTVVDRNHPQGVEYNADNIRFAGQYGRGYQAIEDLFPAAFGYTLNNLEIGTNGALTQRTTGNLDMRGSTIQTRLGGDINILGPGGRVLVGSAGAPPFTAATSNTAAVGPSAQGVLALQTGSVRLFADQSVLLAQSRIFTQQGGDLLLWSSNGDINAGKGAKTSSEVPPLSFSCDDQLFCIVDTSSQVSGAGIAALQSLPGKAPGSANLVAPVGTVDAGDAGIRVSGSLNVAAQQVANADNIQVSGVKIGVPTGVVDTAAVSVASSVAAAVAQSAEQASGSQNRRDSELELFVEIVTPASEP